MGDRSSLTVHIGGPITDELIEALTTDGEVNADIEDVRKAIENGASLEYDKDDTNIAHAEEFFGHRRWRKLTIHLRWGAGASYDAGEKLLSPMTDLVWRCSNSGERVITWDEIAETADVEKFLNYEINVPPLTKKARRSGKR